MGDDLYAKLRSAASQLHEIASEYDGMKTPPSEEARVWPLSILVEEDGEIGLWCNKPNCFLDGENSKIGHDLDVGDFTVADILYFLEAHIEQHNERAAR